VVAGCPACKKRLQSMNEFLRHLAEDAMPSLLDRLSSKEQDNPPALRGISEEETQGPLARDCPKGDCRPLYRMSPRRLKS
jgi:hypothetical protein